MSGFRARSIAQSNLAKRELHQRMSEPALCSLYPMNCKTTTPEYAKLFSLPDSHTLETSSTRKVQRDSVVYETRWLLEHDDNRALIARFRAWNNRSLKPPYKQQQGWERFSPSGTLLDREVRYSKRDDEEYLH